MTRKYEIIVYTRLFEVAETEGKLAFVIAHELAHSLLGHVTERNSLDCLLGFVIAPFITALWAIVPSIILSILVTLAMYMGVHYTIKLPLIR